MHDYILGLLLLLAAASDLKARVVPNWLTLPAMALGLGLGLVNQGWSGVIGSGLGLLAGGLIFLLPFVMGVMGGGDVKLLAAVGALSGPFFTLKVALYACLLGGMVAVGIMLASGRSPGKLKRLGESFKLILSPGKTKAEAQKSSLPPIPFAACLAGGALWARFFDILPGLLGRWAG